MLAAAGSAPHNGGFAQSSRARVTLSFNGTLVLDRGAPPGVEPDVSNGAVCRIELDLGLGDGRGQLPDERPLLRLRPHQRGLPDVSPIVVKLGGARRGRGGEPRRARWRASTRSVVVHGAGPQISAEMERRGLDVTFVGGRRVTTAARRSRSSAPRSPPSTRTLCAAIGPLAVPLFGDEIGLQATPVPELGLVGEPLPSRAGGGRRRARGRADPGRRAARRRAR